MNIGCSETKAVIDFRASCIRASFRDWSFSGSSIGDTFLYITDKYSAADEQGSCTVAITPIYKDKLNSILALLELLQCFYHSILYFVHAYLIEAESSLICARTPHTILPLNFHLLPPHPPPPPILFNGKL